MSAPQLPSFELKTAINAAYYLNENDMLRLMEYINKTYCCDCGSTLPNHRTNCDGNKDKDE